MPVPVIMILSQNIYLSIYLSKYIYIYIYIYIYFKQNKNWTLPNEIVLDFFILQNKWKFHKASLLWCWIFVSCKTNFFSDPNWIRIQQLFDSIIRIQVRITTVCFLSLWSLLQFLCRRWNPVRTSAARPLAWAVHTHHDTSYPGLY